jgi:hypothetical protein
MYGQNISLPFPMAVLSLCEQKAGLAIRIWSTQVVIEGFPSDWDLEWGKQDFFLLKGFLFYLILLLLFFW